MYSPQIVRKRIKDVCKSKKITMAFVLEEAGLSEATLRQMSDKKGISAFSLAKIADCLDISVDYLLGRTDNPEINK
ncbi:MAG: helix-turn-helix domain-containing protein [Candidatus Cryptobacteroides sp.]